MAKDKINYAYTCYRYASESFKAYVIIGNKKMMFSLDYDMRNQLGYWAICGQSKKVIDELKRIYRKNTQINNNKICYGVFELNDKYTYRYIRQLQANKYDMQQKLVAYKTFKQYFEARNWEITEYTQGILDGSYNTIERQDVKRKLDKNRIFELKLVNQNNVLQEVK